MPSIRYKILQILQKFGLIRPLFFVYERLRSANPRVAVRNYSLRRKTKGSGIPIPPGRLIVKVSGTAKVSSFLSEGQLAVSSMNECLEKLGISFGEFGSILDFGCGCGRVIRHLDWLAGAAIVGCDSNAEAINWCKKNIPFARFSINDAFPPLKEPDESLELIYALSVFTHLTEQNQMEWLHEFRRLLKKRGLLILSLRGDYYLSKLSASEAEEYSDGHMVTRFAEAAGLNLCNSYHPESYVRQEFGKIFELVDYLSEGAKGNPYQDLYIFRKREAD